MTNKMFCFQCEQTAGCTGCKGSAGVCGKSAPVANLQDDLTAALIGLAKACMNNGKTENSVRFTMRKNLPLRAVPDALPAVKAQRIILFQIYGMQTRTSVLLNHLSSSE